MSTSLKQKTVSGIWWSGIERFAVQGIQFLIQILMARLLLPSDYGIIGMLAIFMEISQSLIDSGFSNALMQKKDRNVADYSTVFYFNIVIGIIAYLIMFILAPYIANFYDTPMLVSITKVVAINLFISSMAVVQRAKLTINVDFKTQAKASIVAVIIGGFVGIIMAYKGYGVWALVVQSLLTNGVDTILLWIYARWRPQWLFSYKSFCRLFSFGSKLLFAGLLDTVYRNIYTIIIGKKFSVQDLGYYTRADQFAQFPSANLSGIFNRVTYPILCDLQDDNDRLKKVYQQYLRMSAYLVFPLMIGLCVLAEPLIRVVLTDKWDFAIGLLQILAIAYMWYPIHAINLNLLQVKGRSDLFLRLEIIKKIIGVCILIITIPLGIRIMCVGLVVSSLIALFINTYYTGKIIRVGFYMQMKDLLPVIILSVSMGFVVHFGISFFVTDILKLIVGIGIGIIYYVLLSYITRSCEWKMLVELIKK